VAGARGVVRRLDGSTRSRQFPATARQSEHWRAVPVFGPPRCNIGTMRSCRFDGSWSACSRGDPPAGPQPNLRPGEVRMCARGRSSNTASRGGRAGFYFIDGWLPGRPAGDLGWKSFGPAGRHSVRPGSVVYSGRSGTTTSDTAAARAKHARSRVAVNPPQRHANRFPPYPLFAR